MLPLRAVVNTRCTRLNIRPEPSMDAAPITSVPKGTRLTLLERRGDWWRVTAGLVQGWAYADYIRLLN